MKLGEKKYLPHLVLYSFSIAILLTVPVFSHANDIVEVDTVIAPGVLIEDNELVESLTFHAATPFFNVLIDDDEYPVEVCYAWEQCADIDFAFADSRGEFVAKISVAKINELGLESNAYNSLTLQGYFQDGTQFSGTNEIYLKSADIPPMHQTKPQINKP